MLLDPDPERTMELLIVERVVGAACRVGLPGMLPRGPVPCRSVHGNGGPSSAVFVAEVDQQCVPVVLDAQAMPRIRLLVQTPDNLSADAFLSDGGRRTHGGAVEQGGG
jgi:hypothetical protein